MNNSKIGSKEAIYLVITVAIARSILTLPKNILSDMKSSVLLNLVFVGFVLVLLCTIISKLFKLFPGLDILDISEYLGGKVFKRILGFLFIFYFTVSSGILLREFCEAIEIIYYPMTNVVFLITIFIIAVAFSSRLEFTSAIKTTLFIIPLVLISIFFLFISNIDNFSFSRVFPLLGNGFSNTFILGLGNIYSFSGIVLLYFLPPLLKEPEKFKKISIISAIVFMVYLILTVAVILFMFSFFMDKDEILPLYAAARYIEIGSFFVRFESLFLLVWVLVFSCYLSIVTRFSILIFKKITDINSTKSLGYPFSLLILGVSLLPSSYASVKYYEAHICPKVILTFYYAFCILILVFAGLKKKKERKV